MNERAARRYPLRAILVGWAWIVGALPAVLGLSPCPIAALTRVPCPGCGMTRAMRLLAAGDVGASLHMHPLAVPSVVATALVMMATVGVTWTRGTPIDLMKERVGRWVAASFVLVNVAIFIFWVARMLGWFGGRVSV